MANVIYATWHRDPWSSLSGWAGSAGGGGGRPPFGPAVLERVVGRRKTGPGELGLPAGSKAYLGPVVAGDGTEVWGGCPGGRLYAGESSLVLGLSSRVAVLQKTHGALEKILWGDF